MAEGSKSRRPGTDPLIMGLIFGILLGVVLSTIAGQWWWIIVGVAVGAAIGAGRISADKKKRGGNSGGI
jgi:hypothetical protein